MRTFIAIELPQEIKDYLACLQEKLKATGADVKWVAPQNIHLTLKFLGEIDDSKLEKIVGIIGAVSEEKPRFQISISSLGAFPKIQFPRVIWVGVEQGDRETKEIAKTLEEKLQKAGIPKEERAFSSHITIGRTRSGLNTNKLAQEMNMLGKEIQVKNLGFKAERITLFKSTLTSKGPIYEILKEASLKTN
ncbi:MAG: RNA 2',3'-cyclic phosphodiesterase [Candidatus Omnitrophica bacterium]|nr:RNA 2',3'-cyclic phosphodiesterase [Candidatus Omnitrophota bacterium]MBU1869972.1 RNA 2',3'-cyclic phosphodiesterase [Candidatus Omnitrophota bacterium]